MLGDNFGDFFFFFFFSCSKLTQILAIYIFSSGSYCTDVNGKLVRHGDPFIPKGNNVCQHCRCLNGVKQQCFTAECALPTCKDYKAVPGKCCAYTCPSGE